MLNFLTAVPVFFFRCGLEFFQQASLGLRNQIAEIYFHPYYKIGRLVRFKRSEIDSWMEGNKRECADMGKVARKALGSTRKSKVDINRIVRKAVDGAKGRGYTTPHGKPDQVKGLGKEVLNGTL